MEKVINGRIQIRSDTAANWKVKNPILLAGELGIETDTNSIKYGDGSAAWNDLKYISFQADVTCSVQSTGGSATVWIEVPWENVYITESPPNGTDINVIEITS
ncbi:hypothetical protein NXG27_04000 [Megasphaera paucivorans]|uniref:Major tropism determinant N-terminal domain-containing protein n=1 Tax=Megasphaera paucivorans TaxID=349095 RepID=A0A1G9QX40_9FIRM|nr:hypothetical protein [Megasphaera paucivorans]SDM15431.1 hypothetical protein SAMN05660299_00312 [Megasphaera paucivorans]